MKACNVVRFRVKPGYEQRFIDAHRSMRRDFNGFLGGQLIRTGDRTFCIVGQWRSFKHLVAARPQMVGTLDGFRPMLEDLGGGLGLTDPVSGEVVVRHPAARPKKKANPGAKAKAKAKPKRAAPKAKPAARAAAAKRKR
jgi:hypothetical protein